MAYNQNNVALLHRKEWQTMMPAVTATAAAMFVVADQTGMSNVALYITSNTVHYLYHHDEDDWSQIPSGAFAVALAAGACGCYHPWSKTYTANGGSTTTITVAASSFNLNGFVRNQTVEILTGHADNVGLRRTITQILTNAGIGTITLTLDSALPQAVANTDTFMISTGRFFILWNGTLAAGYAKTLDVATFVWDNISITGLPASWGTDGRLVTPSVMNTYYDSGTATSGSSTTLVVSDRTWTTDQWKNYQVRITAGTGRGQRKVITGNDGTTLSFSAGATIDNTSVFVIEGDDNAVYALGNNAVTMYKLTIGSNWATISPGTARAGAPVAGMTADFIDVTGDVGWANVSAILDGRYIYSLRGNSAIIDRYDIAGNAWLATTGVNYTNNQIVFGTNCSSWHSGRYIYFKQASSATVPPRFYKYSIRGNYLEPVTTDWYLPGAVNLGQRIWMKKLDSTGSVMWLYYLQDTSANLRRIMIF